eukprot:6195993-Pleurochrysis_carterae.AAC.2
MSRASTSCNQSLYEEKKGKVIDNAYASLLCDELSRRFLSLYASIAYYYALSVVHNHIPLNATRGYGCASIQQLPNLITYQTSYDSEGQQLRDRCLFGLSNKQHMKQARSKQASYCREVT